MPVLAGQAEDRVLAPTNDAFDEYIGSRRSHSYIPYTSALLKQASVQ